jgi:ATP-dependent RNA helicase DDX42
MLGSLLFQVSGVLAPKPVSSFAHFNFDDQLMKAIRKAGYTQPTPIQAQVIVVLV